MRSLIVMGVAVAAGFTSLTCVAENKSVPALDASVYVEGSLCKKLDQIVFSCPLAQVKKTVSICAAGNAAPHRFYYVFGKPQRIELTYPVGKDSEVNRLSVAKLSFASSWSAVYSFLIQGKKYIVSAVEGMAFTGKSGEQGFRAKNTLSAQSRGWLLLEKVVSRVLGVHIMVGPYLFKKWVRIGPFLNWIALRIKFAIAESLLKNRCMNLNRIPT
ncbi:hypothetical protein [Xanthomonas sp. MUS 060]|uniref:hypothetical protein n=1 Tax=Xanthomonas sp. MUS 060 TaxID=1588031 RepID=UPI0005F298DF|nr:hypothetical protein [Xanthomonas sp. MUS 060]